MRNVNQNPIHEDEVVPKQWIEEHFLSRHGGASTVASDLNMDANQVIFLKEPEDRHHAATKGYADTKLLIFGGEMRNDLSLGNHKVTDMANPVTDHDGVNKRMLEDMIQAQQR